MRLPEQIAWRRFTWFLPFKWYCRVSVLDDVTSLKWRMFVTHVQLRHANVIRLSRLHVRSSLSQTCFETYYKSLSTTNWKNSPFLSRFFGTSLWLFLNFLFFSSRTWRGGFNGRSPQHWTLVKLWCCINIHKIPEGPWVGWRFSVSSQ